MFKLSCNYCPVTEPVGDEAPLLLAGDSGQAEATGAVVAGVPGGEAS